MEWCLEVLSTCDAIVFASDEWENSKGCCMEMDFAKDEGLDIFYLDEFKEIVELL